MGSKTWLPDPKPILALDFDGTLCDYTDGWEGADVIPGLPVDGALEFVRNAQKHFTVEVFSSRARFDEGADAICDWLYKHGFPSLHVGSVKPPAFLTLDDRTLLFTGTWPDPEDLYEFRPWYADPTNEGVLRAQEWAKDWDAEVAEEKARLKAKEEKP